MLPREIADIVLSGLASSGDAICIFDPDDAIVFASDSFRALYDIQPGCRTFEEMMRHCHASGTGPGFSMPVEPWLEMAKARRRSSPRRSFEIDLADGRWLWASETCYNDGWILLFITDITRLKANERLLRLAHDAAVQDAATDDLTGLFNRRYIMNTFAKLSEEAERKGTALSVALVDLDFFKQINDTFGHLGGDEVLRHFAEMANTHLRRRDVVARVGGEEFMILMPETPAPEAFVAIDRLRSAIDACQHINGVALHYTISGGVACAGGEKPDDLFRKCDTALYEAKRSGRNCVRLALP